MGKETNSKRNKTKIETCTSNQYNKEFLQTMANNHWTNRNDPPVGNISENGIITVVVRTEDKDDFITFRGMKFQGNEYGLLFRKLREKNVVPRNLNDTKFYAITSSLWMEVDKAEEKFDSGCCILAIIKKKKRAMVKRKRF